MKNKFIILVTTFFIVSPALCDGILDMFRRMPPQYFPYLDKSSQLDLSDYAEASIYQPLPTLMNGRLKINHYNDSTLNIDISKSLNWQLSFSKSQKDTIYIVTEKIRTTECELTYRTLFDSKWNKVMKISKMW